MQQITHWWSDPVQVSNVIMAFVTVALFLVAISELKINQASAKHTEVIERAYVGLSHYPPGLDFGYGFVNANNDRPNHRDFSIRFEVKNHGNTPATVLGVSLRHFVGPDLPETPEYLSGPRVRGFLVKDGTLVISRKFSLLEERFTEIGKGAEHLWIYGYVDYTDQFGKRHRSGYAREFDWSLDSRAVYTDDRGLLDESAYRTRNNLVFAAKDGYNYDRELAADEV